jgi:hypothetical protein
MGRHQGAEASDAVSCAADTITDNASIISVDFSITVACDQGGRHQAAEAWDAFSCATDTITDNAGNISVHFCITVACDASSARFAISRRGSLRQ